MKGGKEHKINIYNKNQTKTRNTIGKAVEKQIPRCQPASALEYSKLKQWDHHFIKENKQQNTWDLEILPNN